MERHHFQQQLGSLKERLLAMGGLAEDRVRTAMQGLVDRDRTLIDEALNGDMPLNELHIEIDDLCLKLLALHSPMAADLRAVMAAIKINSDLERVGDMAVNIAEAARRYASHPPVKKLIDIPRMASTGMKGCPSAGAGTSWPPAASAFAGRPAPSCRRRMMIALE